MILIDDTILSFDLFDEKFVCDLASCKGICCIEGDSGAPLDWSEIDILEEILPQIWDDLSPASQNLPHTMNRCRTCHQPIAAGFGSIQAPTS